MSSDEEWADDLDVEGEEPEPEERDPVADAHEAERAEAAEERQAELEEALGRLGDAHTRLHDAERTLEETRALLERAEEQNGALLSVVSSHEQAAAGQAERVERLRLAVGHLRAALAATHVAGHMNCAACYQVRDALRDTEGLA